MDAQLNPESPKGPEDFMPKMPKAIEEAKEKLAAVEGGLEADTEATKEAKKEPTPEPTDVPPAAEPVDAAPAIPAKPEVKEDGTEVTRLKAENTKLNSELTVLSGKYNKEVPRLARMVKAQKREVERLMNELEDAKERLSTSMTESVKSRRERLNEEYGEEMVDDMLELMRLEVGAPVQAPKAQPSSGGDDDEPINFDEFDDVEEKSDSAPQHVSAMSPSTYYATLDALMPPEGDSNEALWRQLNRDQDFLTWSTKVTYTGRTYNEELHASLANGDPLAAERIFKDYLAHKAYESSRAAAPNSKRDELEGMVHPGQGSPTSETVTAHKTISMAGAKKVYARAAKDAVFRDSKEFSDFKRSVDEAMREGRIVQ